MVAHHEALGGRFITGPSGWPQLTVDGAGVRHRCRSPRSTCAGRRSSRRAGACRSGRGAAGRARSRARAAGARRRVSDAAASAGPLIVVVHHLVVDGVSWRILGEDLETACDQIERGEPVRLPPASTPWRVWAEKLAAYAATSTDLRRELDHWSRAWDAGAARLPCDLPNGANTGRALRVVRVSFDREETHRILTDLPHTGGGSINAVLLAALGVALRRWSDRQRFVVAMEGHGREPPFGDVDLTRTVGWFTSIFPVLLDVAQARPGLDGVADVERQLRAIPQRGFGYGALRYLCPDAPPELRNSDRPDISFNYLGQFDAARPGGLAPRLRLRRPMTPGDLGPDNRRFHAIEVEAYVVERRLRIEWLHGEQHRSTTVRRLARFFAAALKDMFPAARALADGVAGADVRRKRSERMVAQG